MQTLDFRAMGSQMRAIVDSDSAPAGAALARVPALFEEWEQILSRFRPDSELSLLNRRSLPEVVVSPVFWEVLRESLAAADLTGGLVTPTMLTALESAGYDRSFDQIQGEERLSKVIRAAPAAADDWHKITLGPNRRVTLPSGMRLDFGGIAKGWAADMAAAYLSEYGPALVDAGGDVSVSGLMRDGAPWPVAVSDPALSERTLDMLALRSGGVATSGRDYRRWKQGNTWQHHILDPRTGRPAGTDVLSATVVGRSTREAEVAAKAGMILGGDAGMAWIEDHMPLAALLVLEDGTILRSSRWHYHVWS